VLDREYPENSTELNYLSTDHPLPISRLRSVRTEICARQDALHLALLRHVRKGDLDSNSKCHGAFAEFESVSGLRSTQRVRRAAPR
jgi:hypothetical protein